MIRYCITDRELSFVGMADWVQIRDKELAARELIAVVRRAVHAMGRVLVNSRVDVAIAAGAAGVHLPSGSIAASEWRAITPPGFLIGVSCHYFEEVAQAEEEGADYVLFGPVFAPLSKTSDLAPRGVEELRRVCGRVRIPVLALGGITWENSQSCVEAGAAGVAGITLFRG
ncbi:MAG TPA: thiamine phosphate synthase [Bryobacteraceae bacterium]|jgi:thiamine-phosphate pyrophosphorylase|nr:thiamine phosphate synthase [Bryobacteraceae bacterium]